jgi:hypothetical protein
MDTFFFDAKLWLFRGDPGHFTFQRLFSMGLSYFAFTCFLYVSNTVRKQDFEKLLQCPEYCTPRPGQQAWCESFCIGGHFNIFERVFQIFEPWP